MKKFTMFLSAIMLALVLIASPVFAGSFHVENFAVGGAVDGNAVFTSNGIAGGISGAGGVAGGQAAGAGWGKVGGVVILEAGRTTLTVSDSWKTQGQGLRSGGVYSASTGFATTNGSTDIYSKGFAASESTMFGAAGQATLNGSAVVEPNTFRFSKGFSGGVAGQGAVGGFIGVSGSLGWGDVQTKAGMTLDGNSYSESFTFEEYVQGSHKTEGMGTEVGAFTTINSYGGVDINCIASGFVEGGWAAAGGAAAKTVQYSDSGFGFASAGGIYAGSGSLGSNYTGSAEGYTQTSITQYQGMKGSIVTSSAGMHVVSASYPTPRAD